MAIPGMNYFCEREWTIVHKKPEDLACWIYNSRGLLIEYEIINIGPDYTSISFANSDRLNFIRLKQRWEF